MRVSRLMMLGACALALATPARAQQPASGSNPVVNRYLVARGGATLRGEAVPSFGGEYGERISKNVIGFITLEYHDDLASDLLRDNLAAAGVQLTQATGIPREFSGRDRGLAFTAGGKYQGSSGTIRPFVGAGVGVLSLRRTISESTLGNVTGPFSEQTLLNDGMITAGQTSTLKPLMVGLAGVSVVKGRGYVDLSVRYGKAFHGPSLDYAQVAVGVGMKF